MGRPEWAEPENEQDDQRTIISDQEDEMPPTIRMPDAEPGGWGQPQQGGFRRAVPADADTPQPYQTPAEQPFAAPSYQAPTGARDKTMIITERPTPVFAWLVVVDGPDRNSIGKVHTLHPDTTTIGRTPGNQIVVSDDTCSAQHARIRKESKEDEEPAFVLYDMGSRNGTFVGDKETYEDPSSQKYRHELQDGDYMLIGETTLVFKRL
jgi:hypothetical protein